MLADLILGAHAAFAAFIVVGLPLIFGGACLGWNWVRNAWFRCLHLAAITVVVALSWLQLPCPLTVWESRLRHLEGSHVYPEGFIPFWLHRVLFYQADTWVFTTLYTAFAVAVIASWILCPPRFKQRRRGPSARR